jgi:hypothetical protein
MREFMNILDGAYGFDHWWITPDGRAHKVEDHHSSASEEFGNYEFEDDDTQEFTSAIRSALAQGWVRAAHGGEPNLQFTADWAPGRASDKAFKTLARLVGKLPEAQMYRLGQHTVSTKREAIRLLLD